MLFARALLAFLVLPFSVGFLVPWWIAAGDRSRGHGIGLGWLVVVVGGVLLPSCVRDFYRAGKGTLAPWDPPRRLVVVGLYRFVRNPMYLAVLTLVIGWALVFGSLRVGAYVVVLAIVFHLRTIWYEEPRLAELFGAEWERYRSAVPRWVPRSSPWRGD